MPIAPAQRPIRLRAAVNDGLSLLIIGALLGHPETRTTQRYAHSADDPPKLAAAQVVSRIAHAMLSPK